MTTFYFPSSISRTPVDQLKPTLGSSAVFTDPILRRIYLAFDSNGLGDVVNLVPLVQELVAARPDVDLIVSSSQWRIPFRWCGPRVSTIASPPPPERGVPGTLCIDLTDQVRYHLYSPHWLQFFFISGVGTYTRHTDPFPLIDEGEVREFAARLQGLADAARGYVLLHLENTRREWEGRNTDPANLLTIARKLSGHGYRILEIGNDNPPSGEFTHLGTLAPEELIYATKHSAGFVGIDSFPMHIAALYDKPILGFFAATQPEVVLPPVSRLTVLRNEALRCNGCVYITRPRHYNKCTLGKLECMHSLPDEYLHDRFERFLRTLESSTFGDTPANALEHTWRMAQLLFEETALLDRLRGKRYLTNELRRRIAASISSETA